MSTVKQTRNRSDRENLAIPRARINVKSLAYEAKLIRDEVARARKAGRKTWVLDDLNRHRRHELRQEARISQLALAFLRGRPYRSAERKSTTPVDFNQLVRKIHKLQLFCARSQVTDIREWLAAEVR